MDPFNQRPGIPPPYVHPDSFVGGGGGSVAQSLKQRIEHQLRPVLDPLGKQRRLVGVLVAHNANKLVADELLPKLDYWHLRSGDSLDLFCCGFGDRHHPFDAAIFVEHINWLERVFAWRYGGNTELLLLNARLDPGQQTVVLEADRAIAVDFEAAITAGALISVGQFMEQLFASAKTSPLVDPTWDFSDSKGKEYAKSALWNWFFTLVPEAVRDDAKRAKLFAVRSIAPKS